MDAPGSLTIDATAHACTVRWTAIGRPHRGRQALLNLLGFAGIVGAIGIAQVLGGPLACVVTVFVFFGGAYMLGSADDPSATEHELVFTATGLRWSIDGGEPVRCPWPELEEVGRLGQGLGLTFGGRTHALPVPDEDALKWLYATVGEFARAAPSGDGDVDAELVALLSASRQS